MIIGFNLIYKLILSWLKQNFSRVYKLLHVFWNTLYFVWLRITDVVLLPAARIWSIVYGLCLFNPFVRWWSKRAEVSFFILITEERWNFQPIVRYTLIVISRLHSWFWTIQIIIPHVNFQQSDWSIRRVTILNVTLQCLTVGLKINITFFTGWHSRLSPLEKLTMFPRGDKLQCHPVKNVIFINCHARYPIIWKLGEQVTLSYKVANFDAVAHAYQSFAHVFDIFFRNFVCPPLVESSVGKFVVMICCQMWDKVLCQILLPLWNMTIFSPWHIQ